MVQGPSRGSGAQDELRVQVRAWLNGEVPAALAVPICEGYCPEIAPENLRFGHVVQAVGDLLKMVADAAEDMERIFDESKGEIPADSKGKPIIPKFDWGDEMEKGNDTINAFRGFLGLQETLDALAGKEVIPFAEMVGHKQVLGQALTAFEQAEAAVQQEEVAIRNYQEVAPDDAGIKELAQVAALRQVMSEEMKPPLAKLQQKAVGRGPAYEEE